LKVKNIRAIWVKEGGNPSLEKSWDETHNSPNELKNDTKTPALVNSKPVLAISLIRSE
jgi:hypothetical protein